MPFAPTTRTATANSALGTFVTDFDAGTGFALVCIFSGTVPTNANTALAGNTLLANVALQKPSATVTAATLTLSGLPKSDASADASGVATFFRIFSSNDSLTPLNCIYQGLVGTSASDMNLASTTLVAGAAFNITAATISLA